MESEIGMVKVFNGVNLEVFDVRGFFLSEDFGVSLFYC